MGKVAGKKGWDVIKSPFWSWSWSWFLFWLKQDWIWEKLNPGSAWGLDLDLDLGSARLWFHIFLSELGGAGEEGVQWGAGGVGGPGNSRSLRNCPGVTSSHAYDHSARASSAPAPNDFALFKRKKILESKCAKNTLKLRTVLARALSPGLGPSLDPTLVQVWVPRSCALLQVRALLCVRGV